MTRHILIVAALAALLTGCAATPPSGTETANIATAREAWLAGNYERAFPGLQRAARRGEPRAQYAVGYMYYYGQGVEKNTGKALAWIKRAAEAGDALAVKALGRLAGSVTHSEQARSGLAAPTGADVGQ